MYHCERPTAREAVWDFDLRVIVAGSREWDDYIFFSETMRGFLSTIGDLSIIFISGKASSGADNMIIRFCIENHLPWVEFPADWDKYGKSAGYIRNAEMNKVATDLIAFWDAVSRGTKNMIDIAIKQHGIEHVKTIFINRSRR